jgi:hypothetical protein
MLCIKYALIITKDEYGYFYRFHNAKITNVFFYFIKHYGQAILWIDHMC